MEKIKAKDDRNTAIKKFDSCMKDLFSKSDDFLKEIKHIKDSDENKTKIFTLGLNYFYDTQLVAENALNYFSYIANSMLYMRFDEHKDYLEKMESNLAELKLYIVAILKNDSLGLDNDSGNDQEVVIINTKLSKLNDKITNLFENNCTYIFKGIVDNISKIEGTINNLLSVGSTRTDDDYEQLYINARDDYYSSDKWNSVKNGYIDQQYKTRFRVRKPNVDDLINLSASLTDTLSNDEDVGAIWEAYHDNQTMMAKELVKKEFKDSKQIEQLFYLRGKINIIDEWIDDIRFDELPYEEAFEEYDVRTKVVFIYPWTEEKFRGVWKKIYNYMIENKDADYAWCCLNHTMAFYHIIEAVDFCYFMKWLNKFCGKELISDNNIRQVKTDYFVRIVKRQWNIEEMKKGVEEGTIKTKAKNSLQAETKFKKYVDMCIDLRDILRDYTSSHR